jgi:predicted DsbA family dithiol-disulfide isomerase
MKVEIWSDLACPWCYVGKRRFEAALAEFEHRDQVEVRWRSFELDPGAPREREGDRTERLARKYGVSRDRAEAMHRHMTEAGAGDGIEFRFDIARDGNSFDAHRLLHLAAAHGRGNELAERLFAAHFSEGELLSDPDVLERCAVDAGLPAEEVSDLLAGERYAAEVRDDEATAAAFGITAVPFFVVDRAIAASGAQPPAVLRELLDRAWAQRPQVTAS